ncbi:MAG: hypothetical protein KF817_09340 [Phycisphaeraceae bacterium]|nr:hypothetical protein [Phycisphaeraceae bacterium]
MPHGHRSPCVPSRGIAVTIAIGLGTLAPACAERPGDGPRPTSSGQAAAPFADSTPAEQAAVARGMNLLGLRLLQQQRVMDGPGVVLSPLSVATAVQFARYGARGDTEQELAALLGDGLTRERAAAAVGALRHGITQRATADRLSLDLAVALALTRLPELAAESYRDFIRAQDTARIFSAPEVGPINDWVARHTNGRITRILDGLNPNSVCALLDAAYFRGAWARPFDPDRTQTAAFHVSGTEHLEVRMMRQREEFRLIDGTGWTALVLPFAGDRVAMTFVLPDPSVDLAGLESRLADGALDALLAGARDALPETVAVEIPRFRMESAVDLVPPLTALGMTDATSAERADFGGITGRNDARGLIWISQARHRAMIVVDEHGAEAAAATAIEFAARAVPRTRRFVLDRPFLFLVHDQSTGAVLFLGRVIRPAAAAS